MPSILKYSGVLLITFLSSQWVLSLKTPILECYTKGLRLFFQPKEPFYGHIYVKGSFMQKKCHVDYTQNPLAVPSYFAISYRADCNLKCEEQKEPPGINYHLLVVVQNHRMFVTKNDRIYSVNCFYQKGFDSLAQDMEIRNGLTTEKLSSESIVKCTYQVLDSLDGKLVKYANVGDKLFHKWSCVSAKYGMLVHSCYARETDDVAFQLVDDRGCVVDNMLMSPLIYNDNITSAHSIIPAFKFADQLTIRFQCRVTLCVKNQNNCEGITPPVCKRPRATIFYGQESDAIEAAAVTIESASSSNAKPSHHTTPESKAIIGIIKLRNDTNAADYVSNNDTGTIRPRNDTDAADYVSNNDTGTIRPRNDTDAADYALNKDIESTTESNIFIASNRVNNKTGNNKQKRSVNESRLTMNPLSRKFFTVANSTDANRFILDVDADQVLKILILSSIRHGFKNNNSFDKQSLSSGLHFLDLIVSEVKSKNDKNVKD